MSDLDDFFAKRLEEEANFPNRGKNWKHLSKQLDAFHSGSVQGNRPGLRGWQIATVAAVATAGLLLWKTITIHQENKKLRQDIASLQTDRANLADQWAFVEKRTVTPSTAETRKDIPSGDAAPTTTNSNSSDNNKLVYRLPNKARTVGPAGAVNIPAGKAHAQNALSEKFQTQGVENAAEKQSASTAFDEKAPVSPEETGFPQKGVEKMDSVTAVSSEVALSVPTPDSSKSTLPKIDTLLAGVEKPKDTIASVPLIAQEIKPAHKTKSRFRIGAQATLGFVQPRQKGVSSVRGQGLTVEARIFRSLWATASVDWLHHEVSTSGFVPRFHPHHDSLPKPPDGGGGGWQHHSKLVLVESSPQQQHFGLGLRYELPVRFWVRPSVRVAHDWVHVSPTLVTYKFEEEDQGGPGPNPDPDEHEVKYTAEKFDAQWLSNQWRFGIGLEKDIPNWTFGLWADYSKDFSSANPSFDVLYLRAGAQYRF